MPAFKKKLTAAQIDALAERSLALAAAPPRPEATSPPALSVLPHHARRREARPDRRQRMFDARQPGRGSPAASRS